MIHMETGSYWHIQCNHLHGSQHIEHFELVLHVPDKDFALLEPPVKP